MKHFGIDEVRDMIKEGRVQLWTCPSLTYKQSFTKISIETKVR